MKLNIIKSLIVGISLFFSLGAVTLADTMGTQCNDVSNSGCGSLDAASCKTLLQQCSDYYDQQSTQISQDITKTSQQKNTLATQISLLKSKITNLEGQISQGKIKVQGLNLQITDTQSSITKTSQQIQDSQQQIATVLRAVAAEDDKPLVSILLEGNLSDFFGNLVSLENLNSKLSNLLSNTQDLQSYLTTQKGKMDTEVTSLQSTIALQKAQEAENQTNKQTQEQYLQMTETQYQQQLAQQQDVQAKASKIKALLFQMVGVTNVPTFGDALEVAKSAAALVNVRPAFLLAIISQESAIGKNTGQCILTDSSTGNGKKKTSGAPIIRVMSPTRDIPPFLTITAALGRDPYNTPVSCWISDYRSGVPVGWGGAMGPAQFIPSTWVLFADKLQTLLGVPADPWGVKDSFTAAGLYLAQLGATAQTASAEKTAASRYYGGSSSYASSVYNRATCIQSFIDTSTMSTYCQNLIF